MDLATKSLSEGIPVDEVYLDFLKAFDMVPHRRLILKLSCYGVRDDLLAWFESYLFGRRQRVLFILKFKIKIKDEIFVQTIY